MNNISLQLQPPDGQLALSQICGVQGSDRTDQLKHETAESGNELVELL